MGECRRPLAPHFDVHAPTQHAIYFDFYVSFAELRVLPQHVQDTPLSRPVRQRIPFLLDYEHIRTVRHRVRNADGIANTIVRSKNWQCACRDMLGISQDKVPIIEPAELFIELTVTLDQASAMNDGVYVDIVARQQLIAIERPP